MKKKLRLGVLISSMEIPAWAVRALEHIAQSGAVETCLLIIVDRPSQSETGASSKNGGHLVYRLLDRLDERIFVRSAKALEMKDLRRVIPEPAVLRVRSDLKGKAAEIEAAEMRRIEEHHLDVILQFETEISGSEVSSAAKYGVWSFDFGAPGEAAGLREVFENIPETGILLKSTCGRPDRTRTLYRSSYFTYSFSPARNRNALYWAASTILSRQVQALYRLGEEAFFAAAGKFDREPEAPAPRSCGLPSNVSALRGYLSACSRTAAELKRRLFYLPTWYLMFALDGSPEIDVHSLRPIFPPKDRFWADPHVIFRNGSYYIFVEEFPYKTAKGRISVIEMDADGSCKDPVCVLEEKYHLSYPFVFEWQGKTYMIPESAQNRSIDLYECTGFPYRWKFCMRLMEGVRAVDTTLFFERGTWWLFTAITESEDFVMPSELFLFYSKDLLTTDWIPHPCNPIVPDIKKARPAGGLFRRDGKIYRPSQFNATAYGYGIDLNEVLLLTETDYLEKTAYSMRPEGDPRVLAMHTYSRVERLSMIDAFTLRRR